jgi:histidyl-tRNA synthetase
MSDEIKYEGQARGTRLLLGSLARKRRYIIDKLIAIAEAQGFEEIVLPSIEMADIYATKAGDEVLNQMYVFEDRKQRKLCLRPEGTATCQIIANETWKKRKDVRLFYETRCYRYERPQAGRYREFTQFGMEILNPRTNGIVDYRDYLMRIAKHMADTLTGNPSATELVPAVKRGLAYYVEDGFEILAPELGAQKQICGGGSYAEGIGFAFGVDRPDVTLIPKSRVPHYLQRTTHENCGILSADQQHRCET